MRFRLLGISWATSFGFPEFNGAGVNAVFCIGCTERGCIREVIVVAMGFLAVLGDNRMAAKEFEFVFVVTN